jgi:ATP-dependent Clp protease ATP-binding subunit ClpA
MGDEYVSTEHLLVGLADKGGQVAQLLRRHGATPDALREAFTKVRGSARVTSPDPRAATRRWRSTAWTSPSAPARASWTR